MTDEQITCRCGNGCGMTKPFVFFRDEGFYPIVTWPCDDPASHAACNPGTRRIEDMHGNILWQETAQ